jgi:hypothetical protein
VLIWIVAINMLTVWADIVRMELSRAGALEAFLPEAIFNSSWAIFFVAAGMGFACRIREGQSGHRRASVLMPRLDDCDPRLLFFAYLVFFPVMVAVKTGADLVPAMTQPAIAFGALKFVLIYLVAARTFAGNASFAWLVAIIVIELVLGSSGYFSNYKEAFFVVLIALAASERAVGLRAIAISLAGAAVVVYMSIVWSGVKQEFRASIVGSGPVASVKWLAGEYFSPDIDLAAASMTLLDRISYSKFYAQVLGRDLDAFGGIYLRAVEKTLTPRFLFPDKAVLDDSVETNALLGWDIQRGTSIGIGYVAQAQVDFGFPGMAVPLGGLGAMIGLMYRYILTRRVPVFVGQGFACAVLFNCLAFAGNIDKQLGSLVMQFLVAAICLRFGVPHLIRLTSRRDRLVRTVEAQRVLHQNFPSVTHLDSAI